MCPSPVQGQVVVNNILTLNPEKIAKARMVKLVGAQASLARLANVARREVQGSHLFKDAKKTAKLGQAAMTSPLVQVAVPSSSSAAASLESDRLTTKRRRLDKTKKGRRSSKKGVGKKDKR